MPKSRRGLGLAVGAACLAAAALAPVARATVITVPPGQSIQAAVNAASAGDVIRVVGHHRESVTIIKDGITLRGVDAVLTPPRSHAGACDPFDSGEISGICLIGQFDPDTGVVTDPVSDVTIARMRISGFGAVGIVALGASHAQFIGNTARDDGEYGLAAFFSNGTAMISNRAFGADEAGLYIGDSHPADAVLRGNNVARNAFGIFLRDSEGGVVTRNRVHDNCVGLLQLADEPGPAGNYLIRRNVFRNNSRACPESEDGPPLSGIGVAILGGHDNRITLNLVARNVPTGPTFQSAGIAVLTGLGGTPPIGNKIRDNALRFNTLDLLWDSMGTGNVFAHNACSTSDPSGLC